MRRLISIRLLGLSTLAFVVSPLFLGIGCGGKTDIDYQGPDAATGGKQSGGGTGGANVGGTGNIGGSTGGVGNVGGGGAAGFGNVGNVGGGGVSGAGGSVPDGGVVCGGVVCPPPNVPIGQVSSCCAGDKCGITSGFLGGQCIELGQAGQPDPTCPQQTIQGFTLNGCCKPTGICGVLDTFIGLGCVDPSQFGGPPSPPCGGQPDAGTGGAGGAGGAPGELACGSQQNPGTCAPGQECCILVPGLDYCSDPSTPCACTNGNCNITPATCDGPEDCPGQICCGTFDQAANQYTGIACATSCSGQFEREICHPNGSCINPGTTCSQSNFLPAYMWRCN